MYGVVLIMAMTSAGPSCDCQSGPRICCPATCGCCGVIQFFWPATPFVGAGELKNAKLWSEYTAALSDSERSDVQDLWKKSDDAGRLSLIEQVKAMRVSPKDREPDREAHQSVRPNRPLASTRR